MEDKNDDDLDYIFKIVLIGDSGVGKSSLLSRFSRNEFNEDLKATIGVDFSTKYIKSNDKNIKLQIWDTAGQERYRAVANAYYRGAVGALILYDISKRVSFININKWLGEIKNVQNENNLVIFLIGSKCDLYDLRDVSTEEGIEFAKNNELFFMETSSKSNHNIELVFETMVNMIIEKNKEFQTIEKDEDNLTRIVPKKTDNKIPLENNQNKCSC